MKQAPYLLFLLLITVIYSCNQDNDFADPNYPTIISELSTNAIENIDRLLIGTEVYNCTGFNQFGFCVFNLNDYDLCMIEDSTQATFSNIEILQLAKLSADKFGDFLGVTDTSKLKLSGIKSPQNITYSAFKKAHADSAPNYWSINFKQQNYEGISVYGTSISMICDVTGIVALHGHWYESIYIPLVDEYDEEACKNSLFGTLISDGGDEYTPSDNTYWYPSKKIVLPVVRSKQIEMRVCWALYPELWEVIIDSQNGEILLTTNFE